MGRPQNPARRAELLEQLLALTAQQPLSKLSFRTIAAQLGVSTYTLVYHFGTRRELIDAVLQQAMDTRVGLMGGLSFAHLSREQMVSSLRTACRDSLASDHHYSLRVQFEAVTLEQVDPDVGSQVSTSYRDWSAEFARWLRRQGIPEERAPLFARMMIDTVSGVQYGHLLSNEREQSIEIFDLFLDHFMGLVTAAVTPAPLRE